MYADIVPRHTTDSTADTATCCADTWNTTGCPSATTENGINQLKQDTDMKQWMNKSNALYQRYLSEDSSDRMTNLQVLAAAVMAIVCGTILGIAATL